MSGYLRIPVPMNIVQSVNGQTGEVVLDAADVGADPAGTAQGLFDLLGEKYVRTTRFEVIGSGTSGTVTLPADSQVVLDDFGGTVDAIVTQVSGGKPTLSPAQTAGGVVIATTFDSSGNFSFTGTPSSYPVAVVYRVRQFLEDFDSTASDIWGNTTAEFNDLGFTAANENLSNLTATAINADLVPNAAGTINLGSPTNNFSELNVETIKYQASDSAIVLSSSEIKDSANQTSIDWENRTLVDGADNTALNWDTKSLRDGAGVLSLDWSTRALIDDAGNGSLSYGQRELVTIAGNSTLKWEEGLIIDPDELLSIDWTNRQLVANDGTVVNMDWSDPTGVTTITQAQSDNSDKIATTEYVDTGLATKQNSLGYTPANDSLSNLAGTAINTSLLPDTDGFYDLGASGLNWQYIAARNIGYDGGTAIDFDTKQMSDAGGEDSINFETRVLSDDGSLPSVQYGNRALLDNNGTEALSWQSRYLADDSEIQALDWIERRLWANDGATTVLDWSQTTGPTTITQLSGDNSAKIATTAYADATALGANDYLFGSGLDGNVTLSSGTTTLTQDACYNNLTINGTGKLSTNGFRVFVRGTLDLTAAPAGAIEYITTNGGNSGGTTAGTQAGTLITGTIGAAQRGQAALAGGTAAGSAGGSAATTNTLAVQIGGRGGAGGLGASGGGGAQGGIPTIQNTYINKRYDQIFKRGTVLVGGGSQGSSGGSGGGDGTAGGGSGASGSSGGIVWIAANIINRGVGTAAGAIRALGGNGGNGGTPAAGNRGGGGGGGGGSGGYVFLAFNELVGTLNVSTLIASGGSGGNGGNGTGTGIGGNGGANGGGGTVFTLDIGSSTYTITSGPTSTAGGAASGATGGIGAVRDTFGVDL
jgi:hypothetical protein